ncbi:MAG: hypothetical protein LBM75_10950 [Myxococcales bacterium]|jgi:hypothetical protein|nr:hypothetical protein [Myxococcales bacterium]
MRVFRVPAIVVMAAVISMTACGNEETGDTGEANEKLDGVKFMLAGMGQEFVGNSVRICGVRLEEAASEYNCSSVFPTSASSVHVTDGERDCPCFNFGLGGQIVDPTTGNPVTVNGLCASTDAPAADWSFDYAIYQDSSCTGPILNTPESGLTCYSPKDLFEQAYPNQTMEQLLPGVNTNKLVCVTENALKTFYFQSCFIGTTAADLSAGHVRYNCECQLVENQCNCGPGGLTASDLPENCSFDQNDCTIDCSTSPSFTCTDTIFISSSDIDGVSTQLYTLDPTTWAVSLVSSTDEFGYDAIGFNHLDGFIYGISHRNPDGSQPRLLRIDRLGNITDLGVLPGLENSEWITGTFTEDGTYVVGDFGNKWATIDVKTPAVTASGDNVNGVFNSLSWAASPIDGKIYGYHYFEQELSIFDPATQKYTFLPPPLLNVGMQACSSAFKQSGEMLLYCKTDNPDVDELYSVDVDARTATPLSVEPVLSAGDMASCVFNRPADPQ